MTLSGHTSTLSRLVVQSPGFEASFLRWARLDFSPQSRRFLTEAMTLLFRHQYSSWMHNHNRRDHVVARWHNIMTLVNKPTSIVLVGPKRHPREWPSKSWPWTTRRGRVLVCPGRVMHLSPLYSTLMSCMSCTINNRLLIEMHMHTWHMPWQPWQCHFTLMTPISVIRRCFS